MLLAQGQNRSNIHGWIIAGPKVKYKAELV